MLDADNLRQLATEHGTPLWVYSLDRVRGNAAALTSAFAAYPRTRIAYAVKANALPSVLGVLADAGLSFDAASGHEYELARQAGASGDRIVFNGPLKTDAELERAFAERAVVNVDSFDELRRIVALSRGRRWPVGLRVHFPVVKGHARDRFGFAAEDGEALAAAREALASGLELAGLHVHVGSYTVSGTRGPAAFAGSAAPGSVGDVGKGSAAPGSTGDVGTGRAAPGFTGDIGAGGAAAGSSGDVGKGNAAPVVPAHAVGLIWPKPPGLLRRVSERLARLALEVERELGVQVGYLDVGGGLPFASQAAGYAEQVYGPLAALPWQPELIVEPGRAIVADAGVLLTRVAAVRSPAAVVTDAGINCLPSAIWRDVPLTLLDDLPGRRQPTTVYGPLCLQTDILNRAALLPPLPTGALLAAFNAGAYNLAQSSAFIFPAAKVVLS